MSLTRRSHTYLLGEVGNKAQTISPVLKTSIFQGSILFQMNLGCQGMFFPDYMYSIETILYRNNFGGSHSLITSEVCQLLNNFLDHKIIFLFPFNSVRVFK